MSASFLIEQASLLWCAFSNRTRAGDYCCTRSTKALTLCLGVRFRNGLQMKTIFNKNNPAAAAAKQTALKAGNLIMVFTACFLLGQPLNRVLGYYGLWNVHGFMRIKGRQLCDVQKECCYTRSLHFSENPATIFKLLFGSRRTHAFLSARERSALALACSIANSNTFRHLVGECNDLVAPSFLLGNCGRVLWGQAIL